jgi:hypothetical protein
MKSSPQELLRNSLMPKLHMPLPSKQLMTSKQLSILALSKQLVKQSLSFLLQSMRKTPPSKPYLLPPTLACKPSSTQDLLPGKSFTTKKPLTLNGKRTLTTDLTSSDFSLKSRLLSMLLSLILMQDSKLTWRQKIAQEQQTNVSKFKRVSHTTLSSEILLLATLLTMMLPSRQ